MGKGQYQMNEKIELNSRTILEAERYYLIEVLRTHVRDNHWQGCNNHEHIDANAYNDEIDSLLDSTSELVLSHPIVQYPVLRIRQINQELDKL
jgi:hypothetical protein